MRLSPTLLCTILRRDSPCDVPRPPVASQGVHVTVHTGKRVSMHSQSGRLMAPCGVSPKVGLVVAEGGPHAQGRTQIRPNWVALRDAKGQWQP